MLIVFSGLPGVGKTTLARLLAVELGAVHLRIDSIERALARSSLHLDPPEDAGYAVARAVGEDQLRLGLNVIADSVNPLAVTRSEWHGVADRAGVACRDFEIVCTDLPEHKARVRGRQPDIDGLKLPRWEDVLARDYEPWSSDRIVVDTAETTPEDCAALILRSL